MHSNLLKTCLNLQILSFIFDFHYYTTIHVNSYIFSVVKRFKTIGNLAVVLLLIPGSRIFAVNWFSCCFMRIISKGATEKDLFTYICSGQIYARLSVKHLFNFLLFSFHCPRTVQNQDQTTCLRFQRIPLCAPSLSAAGAHLCTSYCQFAQGGPLAHRVWSHQGEHSAHWYNCCCSPAGAAAKRDT